MRFFFILLLIPNLTFGQDIKLVCQEKSLIDYSKVQVFKFKNNYPNIKVFTYPADHGFNCDHRSQYNEVCSRIAFDRTIKFLNKNLI